MHHEEEIETANSQILMRWVLRCVIETESAALKFFFSNSFMHDPGGQDLQKDKLNNL